MAKNSPLADKEIVMFLSGILEYFSGNTGYLPNSDSLPNPLTTVWRGVTMMHSNNDTLGCRMDKYAMEIDKNSGRTPVYGGKLKLVRVTPLDLGFDVDYRPNYEEIADRAVDRGLHLCPINLVFNLFDLYQNQRNEVLFVGMNPVYGENNMKWVYSYINTKQDGRAIGTGCANDHFTYQTHVGFIFVLPD